MSEEKKVITKTDLAKFLVETGHSKSVATASEIISQVLNAVSTKIQEGNKVVLTGFGTFEIKHRAERAGTNPGTGQAIILPASNTVRFSVGKTLKTAVNPVY